MSNEKEAEIQYVSPQDALEGETPQHSLDLYVDGEKIGSAEIDYFSKPLPLYQLTDLYVSFGHHSKGYGTQIMDQVEEFLKKRKKPGVLIDAIGENEPQFGMYERRGWKRVPDSYGLMVFNWPENVSIDVMKGYANRYTFFEERKQK